jgi:type IX secretion system PorP/SprF family membrane protein
MKILKNILQLFIVIIPMVCNAQQLPIFNHYYNNPILYNPAETGTGFFSKGFIHNRKQWAGIQGAPETYLISVDGPVDNGKIGLGGLLFNDNLGIINKTGAYGSYRYKVKINQAHIINFGASLGYLQNTIAFDKIRVEEITENTLLNNVEKRSTLDAGIGILYNYQDIKIGLASYQLFNPQLTYANTSDFTSLNYRLIRHYQMNIAYTKPLSKNVSLDPAIFLRGAQGMPLQTDVRVYANYDHRLWCGIGYQHNYGVGLSIGSIVYKTIIIGYAYEIPTNSIGPFQRGTHEIMLGYRFMQKGSKPATRNEFNRQEFDHLVKINQSQYEKIDELEQENKVMKEKIISTETKLLEQKAEIDNIKEIIHRDKDKISSIVERNKIDYDEFVKLDLSQIQDKEKTRFYMVVGAYVNLNDAKVFQRILERESGLKTSVFEREDGKYFFVYTKGYQTNDETKEDVNRELKLLNRLNINEYINGNPWIYQLKEE